MSKTRLQVTAQSVRIPVNEKGFIKGDFDKPLYIRSFFEPLQDFFYNKKTHRWELVRQFYYFNQEYSVIYFPAYVLDDVILAIQRHGGDVEIDNYEPPLGAPVEAPMPGFKPKTEIQERAIEFVTDDNIGPVRCVVLDPGLGKTVISFRYTNLTKRRVLVHSSLNIKDWPSRIKNFVDIPEEKIVLLSGQASMDFLLGHIDEIDPVFILVSTQTLRTYCEIPHHELGGRPEPEELMQHLGVHTRINDEAHLHIETNIMLDMRLSTRVVIPLSGTLESSSDGTNAVLQQHYPQRIRFEGSVPNHVYVYDVCYTLNMTVNEFHYMRRDMYSHIALEGWLLSGGKHFLDKIINRVYARLIEENYVNIRKKGQKCLILTVTTDLAEKLKESFSQRFRNFRISTFFSSQDEQIDPLSDIIISTLKSGGTGTDIKNLLTVLNTVAVKSSPENAQNLGRLRTIDGVNPRYIFTTWLDVPKQKEYRMSRLDIYKKRALKLIEEKIVARQKPNKEFKT